MKNFLIASLVLSIIFVAGCTSLPGSAPANGRDDFGCWPPSCALVPDPTGQQFCNDWKAGKPVQWPDCSYVPTDNCKKLCEFETQNSNKTTTPGSAQYPGGASGYPANNTGAGYTPTAEQCSAFASVSKCSYVGSPDSDYYKACAQCFPDKAATQTGIPNQDPSAENVYIYFTDFKHGRIIRMDDMTGKNWISYGENGTGVGQFLSPERFLVQPDGHIYIADPDGNRIVRIDDMTGKGWVTFGTDGKGVGNLHQPHAVRLDAQGRIYIADGGNCRLVRIDDMTGTGWTEYGTGKQCGQSVTTIGNSFDIAFDAQGRIYTVDGTDNPRIIRIDDMTGKGFVTYGTNGTGVGQFLEPQSVTIDAQGRIYVADEDKATQGGRIVRIDDMTGTGWTVFPSNETDPRIALPHDIAISASGRIYVANTRNNGIVRMDDMTGTGYISYAPYPDGPRNVYPTQLEAPKGIFIVPK